MTKIKIGRFRADFSLHLLLLPGVLVTLVYSYGPMLGIAMAFQDFEPILGFVESEWVGWENFQYVFIMPDFGQVVWNTIYISAMKIFLGLLVPLTLALLLNELTKNWMRRIVQTHIFLPFFLSWTVLGGVILELFSLKGPVNAILLTFGVDPVMFLGNDFWFPIILILTDVWKGMGYNMIIFLAAITAINPSLYEAAEVDGAGRWKQMLNITLPGLVPIMVLIFTLSIGNLLNAGFEQILVLYNPTVYDSGDIIDTYVYRLGIFSQQFAPAAAIGLFKSAVSLLLVSGTYYLAYRYSNYKIF